MNNLLGLERMKLLKLKILISDYEGSPNKYELPVVPEDYVMDEQTKRDFLA